MYIIEVETILSYSKAKFRNVYSSDIFKPPTKFGFCNEIWVLKKRMSQGIVTSFSHREFKDLLITQKFTLCQMVDFLYNMDIYDTNVETSKIRIMMTYCLDITSSLPYKIG